MPRFKHILFPVDLSDRCRAAQPFVMSTARLFQAKVTILHVVNIPAAWYGSSEAPYPVMFDIPALAQAGETQIASWLNDYETTQIDRVVVSGDPAEQITALAKQKSVDLIMMPTHGYGKFRSLLLGSVTAKVLHDSDCSVWTATHTEDPGTSAHVDCRSILCAVDLVPESADLLRYAADVARTCNAQLRLIHAVQGPHLSWTDPRYIEFRQNILDWSRERVCVLQRDAGTNLEMCLEVGSLPDVIPGAALRYKADLVVIGRGRSKRSSTYVGTDSHAIICESPCPVLRM